MYSAYFMNSKRSNYWHHRFRFTYCAIWPYIRLVCGGMRALPSHLYNRCDSYVVCPILLKGLGTSPKYSVYNVCYTAFTEQCIQ